MRKALFAVPVLALGLIASPHLQAADAGKFEVAGLRLGMTVAEVEIAAAKRGLKEDHRDTAPDFEQKIAQAKGEIVQHVDHAGIASIRFLSQTEEVKVHFIAMPDGARAHGILQYFTDSDLKTADLNKRIEAEYGTPDQRGSQTWVWGDTHSKFLRVEPYME